MNKEKFSQEILYNKFQKSNILLENQAIEILSYQQAIKEGHSDKIEIMKKLDELNQKVVEKEILVT